MQFYVKNHNKPLPSIQVFPCVLLIRDSWDDYGYKTSFLAQYYGDEGAAPVEIGRLKIMKEGQGFGYCPLREEFQELEDDYCSLWQGVEYYVGLRELGKPTANNILTSLRDAAIHPLILERFKDNEIFQNSLLRVTKALKALNEAPYVLHLAERPTHLSERDFSFSFRWHALGATEPHQISFDFTRIEGFPYRINVIIGRNGVGKTQCLTKLAETISGLGDLEDAPDRSLSAIFDQIDFFSNIIVVSYNPFDNFRLPGEFKAKGRSEREGTLFGYKYCGIRETYTANGKLVCKIKSNEDMKRTLIQAMNKIESQNRLFPISDYIWPLLREPSFQGYNLVSTTNQFDKLSSGQKLSLSILLDVAANIEDESLVLVDEPENHLHPSLLSAFKHSLTNILKETNSYAVFATHSPVVLQEVPARYTKVMKKIEGKQKITELDVESFGEEIGTITSNVFGYNNDMSDFSSVLTHFANDGYSIEQLERLFGRHLGFAAKSLYLSMLELRQQ